MSTPQPPEDTAAAPHPPSAEPPLAHATSVSAPNSAAGIPQQDEIAADPGADQSLLPVAVDNLCRAIGNRGQPCRNLRLADSDYCYRHQPRPVPSGAIDERAPFPELPSPEALTTAAGVHELITRIVSYIARNRDADLPRVMAMRAYTGPLLRAIDVAQFEETAKQARQEVERLTYGRQELITALERECSRKKAPSEEEVETLRATVYRLTRRNEELEQKEAGWLGLQGRLEATVADQHQERQSAERTLADTLERLRKVHRKLCYPCSLQVRTVLGGEPEEGDPDYVERSEYLGFCVRR